MRARDRMVHMGIFNPLMLGLLWGVETEHAQNEGGGEPAAPAQDHLQRLPAGERIKAGKLPDEFKGQRGAIDLTTTHEFR